MALSIAYRVCGPTAALSVAATQHTAVAVTTNGADQCNAALFVNRGATDVCIVLNPLTGYPLTPAAASPSAPTVVFPVDGTPTVPNSFILPAGMTAPIAVAVPAGAGFVVSAIGSAAGPSIVYVTPIALMS